MSGQPPPALVSARWIWDADTGVDKIVIRFRHDGGRTREVEFSSFDARVVSDAIITARQERKDWLGSERKHIVRPVGFEL